VSSYTTEKLQKYHKIYQEIYDNPYIDQREICVNTGITKSTVSRYLQRMYDLSIIRGPSIFVKPAQNYREYAHFLHFDNSRSAYERFEKFSSMKKRSLNCGSWDLLLICEKLIDFSIVKGFKQCIHRGVKGVTYLSKVTSLNWDQCMRKMPQSVRFTFLRVNGMTGGTTKSTWVAGISNEAWI